MIYNEIQQKKKFMLNWGLFYTFLVVLYPLFSMYRFFDTPLSIADVAAIFFILNILIFDFQKVYLNKLFLFVALYIILHTLVSLGILKSGKADLLGSTLRLLLIYFLLSLRKNYLKEIMGKKLLIFVSFLATIYLCIQYLLSFFGIYLGGGIPLPFLKLFRSNVWGYINDVIKYNQIYRPRSIFEEPAHYCQYNMVAIILLQFDKKLSIKSRKLILLFLAFGVIFSMSLLGYVALLFLFLCYLIDILRKKKVILFLSTILIFSIGLILLLNMQPVQNVIINKFVNNNISSDGRFEGIDVLRSLLDRNLFALFFGTGIMDSDIYYSGIIGILVYFGIVGFIIVLGILLKTLKNVIGSPVSIILLLTLVGLNFVSEIIFGKFIITYLIFLETPAKLK